MECFYGYLVSVLSITTTLLLGWQIYTIIKIDKLILSRIKKALKRNKEKAEKDIMGVMGIQMYKMLDAYNALNRNDLVISCYIDSLSLVLGGMHYNSTILVAKDFSNFLKDNPNENILDNDKDRLINNIYEYKSKRKAKKNKDNTDIELLEQIILFVR